MVNDVTNCDYQRTHQQLWMWYQDGTFWKLNAQMCLGKDVPLTLIGRGYGGSILPTGYHTLYIFCNKAIILCVILSSISHFSELLNGVLEEPLDLIKPTSRVVVLRAHHQPAP